MLYLAQVRKNTDSGEMELQLLACQISDEIWQLSETEVLPLVEDSNFNEGVFLLVECTDDRQVIGISEAKDWILNLLQLFLTKQQFDSVRTARSNPPLLEEEREKIEQWRQEITSQSLELNRRALEIETHREQLQELEQTLKQNSEKLIEEQEQLKQERQELQELKAQIGQK
jgi:type I site-specific restriction-modification system R (restriction) subunit